MRDTTRLHGVLHGLWSVAVGEAGYSKPAWKAFEAAICGNSGHTCIAFDLFARLRRVAVVSAGYDPAQWDELERLIFVGAG